MTLWLKHLWLGPVTLAGMLFALICGSKYYCNYSDDGVIAYLGFSGPLKWYMEKGGYAAITIGAAVIFKDIGVFERVTTRRHEQQHVKQGFKWGVLFPIAYGLASVWAWARKKHYYWDNVFEIDARASEKKV